MPRKPREFVCVCGRAFSTANWPRQKYCSKSCGSFFRSWTPEQEEYLRKIIEIYPAKRVWQVYQDRAKKRGWSLRTYQSVTQKAASLAPSGRHSQGFADDWYPIREFADWCGVPYWKFRKFANRHNFPVRTHGKKKGAHGYVRKKDFAEWIYSSQNMRAFKSMDPKIENLEHILSGGLLARLERTQKVFSVSRDRKFPVRNEATGIEYESVSQAAKLSYCAPATILRSARLSQATRSGDLWVAVRP